MAIDIKSLTQLITEFRALQSKDAVSPESLGYILQRIADLLATAGTSETVAEITKLLNNFKNGGAALTAIRQGQADRNHIYATIDSTDYATGEQFQSNGLFIQQATTERAGAMRAQQVTDLNTARNNINGKILPAIETHEKAIALLQSILGLGDGTSVTNVINTAQISCDVVNGNLNVKGASKLVSAGYVPYLFRLTRKRNQYHEKQRTDADRHKKYCPIKKGWHLYGSCYAVSLQGDTLCFSTNSKSQLHKESDGYSSSPSALVHVHTNAKGYKSVAWGRSTIVLNNLENAKNPKKMRLVRLRFAVGFAKLMTPGKAAITPANLVSSLAEFSLVFDPNTEQWSFSK